MPLIKVVFHSWLMFSNPLCNASVVIKYKNFYGKPNFRQLLKTTFTAFQFHSGAATCLVCLQSKNQIICGRANGGSREGAQGAQVPPLILGKKEEMTEGRKASMPSKSKMPPPSPLSSMSGSATACRTKKCFPIEVFDSLFQRNKCSLRDIQHFMLIIKS